MSKRKTHPPASDTFELSKWLHPSVKEVFRDGAIWVLDKPAGILSHPNPPASRASNVLLRAPYDHQRELFRLRREGEPERRVTLVHRLDLETSGLILCALSSEAASALKEALYEREVDKEYRALLVGSPRRDEEEWRDRLEKKSLRGKVEARVNPSGKPNAMTLFRVIERFPRAGVTLVSLSPKSGRTHQLRVQAAARGFPIAGDDRYGDFAANRFLADSIGLRHMFLHAFRLEFRHPTKGHVLRFRREPGRRLSGPLERLAELTKRVPRRAVDRSPSGRAERSGGRGGRGKRRSGRARKKKGRKGGRG